MIQLGAQGILEEETAFEKTHSMAMEKRSHWKGKVMDWWRQVREGGPDVRGGTPARLEWG